MKLVGHDGAQPFRGGFPQMGGLVKGHSHTDPLDDLSKFPKLPPCLESQLVEKRDLESRSSEHSLGWAIMGEPVADRLPHSCVSICSPGIWCLTHTVRSRLCPWRNHLNIRAVTRECGGSVSLVILGRFFDHLTLRSSRPPVMCSLQQSMERDGSTSRLGGFSQRVTLSSELLPPSPSRVHPSFQTV